MEKFIEYSKKIGKDFMLCQGPGGNTSFKQNDYIFIKKSGLQLADSNLDTFKKIKFAEINNFYSNSKINDEKFDKDLFRKDIGNLIEGYQEVARRLNILHEQQNIRPIRFSKPTAVKIKKNK